MHSSIISVEDLGKAYWIGQYRAEEKRIETFNEFVSHRVLKACRKAADIARGQQVIQGDRLEQFWALKNINVEINEGEIVGIIGRNGAGKSTLLKILSRITEPTTGRVTLRGRVASLLEVGTGFHPELSGRENIFLNGAILGMSRAEIKHKLDEIVSFAGISRFLDTPVKRYSSGMYVRLAFAVAAHLEPEILVVDEVLAVGDTEFQKKCIGKMKNVAAGGRTVLFVSHNMSAIRRLCQRCLLFDAGQLLLDDECATVIREHLGTAQSANIRTEPDLASAGSLIESIRINDNIEREIAYGDPMQFDIRFSRPLQNPRLICAIYNSDDLLVVDFDGLSSPLPGDSETPVSGVRLASAPTHLLPGAYYANILINSDCLNSPAHYPAAVHFNITEGMLDNHFAHVQQRGIISMPFLWTRINERPNP